jgi:hypothetical protein
MGPLKTVSVISPTTFFLNSYNRESKLSEVRYARGDSVTQKVAHLVQVLAY